MWKVRIVRSAGKQRRSNSLNAPVGTAVPGRSTGARSDTTVSADHDDPGAGTDDLHAAAHDRCLCFATDAGPPVGTRGYGSPCAHPDAARSGPRAAGDANGGIFDRAQGTRVGADTCPCDHGAVMDDSASDVCTDARTRRDASSASVDAPATGIRTDASAAWGSTG